RQALKQPAASQSADHRAEVVFLVEKKDVEKIAEGELSTCARYICAELAALFRVLQVGKAWRRKLAGGCSPDRIVDAGGTGEERHAEFHERPAAHFREPHFKQHLLTARATGQLQKVDNLCLAGSGFGY